jgi:hypothetical protein
MLHLPEIPFAGCWAFSWTSDIAGIATLWESWAQGTSVLRIWWRQSVVIAGVSHFSQRRNGHEESLMIFMYAGNCFSCYWRSREWRLCRSPTLFLHHCAVVAQLDMLEQPLTDTHTQTQTHTHNQKIELTWFPGGFAQNQQAREKRWEKGLKMIEDCTAPLVQLPGCNF